MRAPILARLQADATLAALLPGGIYDGAVVGQISRIRTPAAFDSNKELRPCALLRLPTPAPAGPAHTSAREAVSLVLYERRGQGSIGPARDRCYALLHRVRVNPGAGQRAWQVDWAGDVRDVEDSDLDAAMIISRYSVFVIR